MTERSASASRTERAWSVVKSRGTSADITRGAYYLARGRFADVVTLAARIERIAA